ncbi:carbon-nitrogen hydrolase family protein [Corynebacterium sp. CCM 9203]|uniref:carbon-nitrogen hydrolase family protein n=1 Tax=Corynebacterium sp. CCM 9203 TaxID=3057615 RepID=UPI00352403E0
MRVALVQMQSTGDVSANLDAVVRYSRTAAGQGAELIVFPEATMRAFTTGRLDTVAEPLDGPFASTVRKLAEELGVTVIVGMFTPADSVEVDGKTINRVHNTALLTGGGKHIGYRKIHCYDAFGFRESDTVCPGNELVTVKIGDLTVGLAICYDVRFPEQFVALAENEGAEVIVLPTSWSDGPGKLQQWRVLTGARALDSTCYVLAAGQARPGGEESAGENDGPTGIGHSAAIGPDGLRIVEAGYGEDIIYADIDVATVVETRRSIPVLGVERSF